jgi:F0F1-type ATP synthase membrane subunit b/b'
VSKDPFIDDPLEEEEVLEPADDAEGVLQRALDTVSTARTMPLSASVLVDRQELLDLLQGALERLPDELRQARWLLRERDEFLATRQREADMLLEDVRAQAERMVQRTEIVRQANQVAQRILDDAREESRRLRHEAEDYCDQRLASFEIVLERTLKTVQAGREKLNAVPPPLPEDEMRRVGADGSVDALESGFFDQDEGGR